MSLHPDEIAARLIGRTIVAVSYGEYLGWEMTVESITLDDGTVVELSGNADVAIVVGIMTKDGEWSSPCRQQE